MGAFSVDLRRWSYGVAAAVVAVACLLAAADLWTGASDGGEGPIAPHIAQLVLSLVTVAIATPMARRRRDLTTWLVVGGSLVWMYADVLFVSKVALGFETSERLHESTYLVGQLIWLGASVVAIRSTSRLRLFLRASDGALFAAIFVFALVTYSQDANLSQQDQIFAGTFAAVNGATFAFFYAAVRGARESDFYWSYLTLAASSGAFMLTDTVHFYSIIAGNAPVHQPVEIMWIVALAIRLIGVGMLARVIARNRPAPSDVSDPFRFILPFVMVVTAVTVAGEPIRSWGFFRQALLVTICAIIVLRETTSWHAIRRYEVGERRATFELERRANQDDLTGLLRRDRMFERVGELIDLSPITEYAVYVAYVDLNEFGVVNNNFGHYVGDEALKIVASRLRQVGARYTGRIGGDEFLLASLASDFDHQPERLRSAVTEVLADPLELGDDVAVRVSASVGIAVRDPGDLMTVDELIMIADHDAFAEKFDVKRRRATLTGLVSQSALTSRIDSLRMPLRALREDRLLVWFQPIIDLSTGDTAGAEALVRLLDDDGNPMPAAEFLPNLQAAGYSHEVTTTVLHKALKPFAQAPVIERGWFVNVNLSVSDLSDRQIVSRVDAALNEVGLPPDRLVLEIDEQLDPTGGLIAVVNALRQLGVGVALDDFGAGSSAFGQIAQVAPAVLKLDIGLLPDGRDLSRGPMRSAALVEAFIRLAHHLDIKVIAEGVETDAQRHLLRELGCDYAQGYLWSPARPWESFGEAVAIR